MPSRSSIFDSIRVKPKKEEAAKKDERVCDWEGCNKKGLHKAPKGRDREGEFYYFCAEHVREYNKNYNYFSGMDDDTIASYQKESSIGNRPTWEMGVNSWGKHARGPGNGRPPPGVKPWLHRARDPHGFYGSPGKPQDGAASGKRKVKRLEKQYLDKLGLSAEATPREIKSKYKQLVKMHHPDANGGDRSSEDRLREIIQAYNFLKSAGFTD
ncbi:MAG: DnaJ domain-containing protein [Pseudomonadota bacterium]